MNQISNRTGIIPAAIVSDHGSDLLLGIKDYCKGTNGQTVEFYDVCHKVACELKKLLADDAKWTDFSVKAAATKRLLYSTEAVCFAPPNQRRKGRYMNVDILIGWAKRILDQWTQIPGHILEKLQWVWDAQEEIFLWSQWIEIGQQTRNQIRQNGFHASTANLLSDQFGCIPMELSSALFAEKILTYVSVEINKVPGDCRMIGTTEPIESLFGYFKRAKDNLWDQRGGVGRLVLSMASRVGEITEELVEKSLEYSTYKGVKNWLNECLV